MVQRSDKDSAGEAAGAALILSMVGFRDAMVRGDAHRVSSNSEESALIRKVFRVKRSDTVPLAWRYFFRNANTFPLSVNGESAVGAYYNPYIDGWVITAWSLGKSRISLSQVRLLTGDAVLGDHAEQTPRWRTEQGESLAGNLRRSYRRQLSAFQKEYQGSDAPAQVAGLFSAANEEQRVTILARLGAQLDSIAPIYRKDSTQYTWAMDFLSRLATGDSDKLLAYFKDSDPDLVAALTSLPKSTRLALAPTGMYRVGISTVISFGLPGQPAVVVLVSFANNRSPTPEKPNLRSIDVAVLEVS